MLNIVWKSYLSVYRCDILCGIWKDDFEILKKNISPIPIKEIANLGAPNRFEPSPGTLLLTQTNFNPRVDW